MNEKKLKHLEFIQNVIARMNTNSFMIKGWAVTLVAALFVLSNKTAEQHLYIIAFIPVPLFWILDAFFLGTERRYRKLYKKVTLTNEDNIDFNMHPYHDVKLENIGKGKPGNTAKRLKNSWALTWSFLLTWLGSFFSLTLILFYGVMIFVMIVVKNLLSI